MNGITILAGISIWIIVLPMVIGISIFKKLDYDSRLVLLIVLVGSIPQIYKVFTSEKLILRVLYNAYTPLEFCIYAFLFNRKIVLFNTRFFFSITIVLFILTSIFLLASFGVKERFLNEWVVVNNILQIFWVYIFLLDYYKFESSFVDTNEPFFWYLCGILAYASCTSVFYSLWHSITENESFRMLKLIHHMFNISLYLFFSVGLLKNQKSLTGTKK